MASVKLTMIMCMYVIQPITTTTETFDMLFAIAETQHTFCNHSSYCYEFGNQSLDASSLRELWNDQFIFNDTMCCESCSCDSECQKLGTCCPDVHLSYDEFSESLTFQKIFCEPLQLKSGNIFNNTRVYPTTRKAIDMITKCPETRNHNDDLFPRRKRDDLNHMCENEDISDISTKIPVTYIPSWLTFRNKYCAECHGFRFAQFHAWNLQIVCANVTFDLTKPLSMSDLLSEILISDECNIFFSPRDYFPKFAPCELYVSACNISGKWRTYNPIIDTACSTYTAPYMKKYKNIFCYMCNVDEGDKDDCKTDFTFDDTAATFSIVLRSDRFVGNYITEDAYESDRCPGNAIYDKLQKVCLHIKCLSPKIYINGSCTNLASAVGGVGYKVFLHLKQTFTSIYDVTGYAIEAYFGHWIDLIGLEGYINSSSIYFKTSSRQSNSSSVFGFYFEFYLPADYPQNVTLIDSIYDMHDTIVQINIDGVNETRAFQVRLDHANICPDSGSELCFSTFDVITENRFALLHSKTYEISDNVNRGLEQDRSAFLLPTYSCPLVTLDSHFYAIRHYNFGVKLEALSIVFSKAEYMEREGSFDINICKHTFDMIQDKAVGGGAVSYMYKHRSILLFLIPYHVAFMFLSATYI